MTLELFLKIFIEQLETKGIKYCILRNYETLPSTLKQGDIDFLVSEESIKEINKIIKSIEGIHIVGITQRQYVHNYFIYNIDKGANSRALQIDFIFKYVYKGVSYLDIPYILNDAKIMKNKQFYIASKFNETFLMFFPFYLSTGTLNKKYENIIISVFQEHQEEFKEYFIRLKFDMTMIENFYKAIVSKDSEKLKKISYRIKSKIFLHHFNPLNILNHYFTEVKLRMFFSNSFYIKVELNPENMKVLYLSLDSFAKNIIFVDLNNLFDYIKLFRIQTNFTMYIFYERNNYTTVQKTLEQIISDMTLKKGLIS